MKKSSLIIFLLLNITILSAQSDLGKIYQYNTGVFFGVDFSLVKFTGTADWRDNMQQVKDFYFNDINDVMIEHRIYYYTFPYKAKDCLYDFKSVKERNKNTEIKNIFSSIDVSENFSDKMLIAIKTYKTELNADIGVVLFAQKLTKNIDSNGFLYTSGLFSLVYFDIRTKEIIFQIESIAKPKVTEIGFINYWGSAVYKAMLKVTFKKLKKKYI